MPSAWRRVLIMPTFAAVGLLWSMDPATAMGVGGPAVSLLTAVGKLRSRGTKAGRAA